jgi:hypothetical protein
MASPITEVELSQRQGATGRRLGRPMRVDNSLSHQSSRCSAQAAIRGDLIGSNQASAAGIVATGHAPVLRLCRALVEAGHDPALSLEIYRGNTVCLRIRSLAEGAAMAVRDNAQGRPRFVRFVQDGQETCAAAPPIAPNGRGL